MNPGSVLRLVALVASAAILAQADNYCCTAEQYEVSLGQIQGLQLPSGQGIAQLNHIEMAVDFTNNRVGQEIESLTLGTVTKLKIIIDFKNNVMYTIIGQNCTKTEARGDFERCVPKTVHFDGTAYYGDKSMPGQSLAFNAYSFFQTVPKVFTGNVTLTTTTAAQCVPMGTSLMGVATGSGQQIPIVSSAGFYNFTNGISDPSRWFDVPAVCQKSGFGRVRRSPLPISDDYKEVVQLTSIFNSMMLPAFKKQ